MHTCTPETSENQNSTKYENNQSFKFQDNKILGIPTKGILES